MEHDKPTTWSRVCPSAEDDAWVSEELWGKFAYVDVLDKAAWRHEQLLRQDWRAVQEEIQLNF